MILEKKVNRRHAIGTIGKVVIGATAAVVVGGGLATYYSSLPQKSTATATSLATLGACSLTPSLTEGPYFVDEMLNRSDIRSDPSDNSVQDGVPLHLKLTFHRLHGTSCDDLVGANVDVWHCNALGIYSDVAQENTVGKKFLRGYQVTDGNGAVEFTTIYPSWYPGRTIHIHFKVRTYSGSQKTYEFTSQFFCDDSITDQVLAQAPYNARGQRDTTNNTDSVFKGASMDGGVQAKAGAQLLLRLTKDVEGYTGTYDVGLGMP